MVHFFQDASLSHPFLLHSKKYGVEKLGVDEQRRRPKGFAVATTAALPILTFLHTHTVFTPSFRCCSSAERHLVPTLCVAMKMAFFTTLEKKHSSEAVVQCGRQRCASFIQKVSIYNNTSEASNIYIYALQNLFCPFENFINLSNCFTSLHSLLNRNSFKGLK